MWFRILVHVRLLFFFSKKVPMYGLIRVCTVIVFFPKKYLCMIIRVCTVIVFCSKEYLCMIFIIFFHFLKHSFQFLGKNWLKFICNKKGTIESPALNTEISSISMDYHLDMYDYNFFSKKVPMYNYQLFPKKFLCTITQVCTVINYFQKSTYVLLFGYVRLFLFKWMAPMYGY